MFPNAVWTSSVRDIPPLFLQRHLDCRTISTSISGTQAEGICCDVDRTSAAKHPSFRRPRGTSTLPGIADIVVAPDVLNCRITWGDNPRISYVSPLLRFRHAVHISSRKFYLSWSTAFE